MTLWVQPKQLEEQKHHLVAWGDAGRAGWEEFSFGCVQFEVKYKEK